MLKLIKKTFSLFTKEEKLRAHLLLFPMVIAAIIDVIGIAVVFPFITIVSDPESIQQHKKIEYLYNLFHFSSQHKFLITIGIFALFVLVVSNSVDAITNYVVIKFSTLKGYTFSYRLLQKYLSYPYVFFLNKNSANLAKNILTEVGVVIYSVLLPCMQLISKLIAMLFIILLLFFMNPILAIVTSVAISGVYAIIFFVARKRMNIISSEVVERNDEMYRTVNEVFGGIKDIKLLNNESYFLSRFKFSSKNRAIRAAQGQIVGLLPRYAMETIAFSGILIIVLYYLVVQKNTAEILPMLALYAFAGYRLLPGFQFIFWAFTSIKTNTAALDILLGDLKMDLGSSIAIDSNATKKMKLKDKLKLVDLEFSYPGSSDPVINKIDLEVRANTTVGFIGSTGSGKTTTIDLILGLLRPQSGQLMVDGVGITDDNLREWQANLGYVPQHIYLSDDSITKNIAFGEELGNINHAAVEKAAKIANIHEFITNQLPDGYDTVVGERGVRLSGGQRQRIGIARALYRDPGVLILDEATSALDNVTEAAIMDAIHNLSHEKTIIIIAHRLTTLKECDEIFVLEDGSVVDQGDYAELLKRNVQFKKMMHDGS
jgi:ATP-binding cassette, subfamily B, bacterial PglK